MTVNGRDAVVCFALQGPLRVGCRPSPLSKADTYPKDRGVGGQVRGTIKAVE
jgi:hypothetical protein